jgi:hypothetical protein
VSIIKAHVSTCLNVRSFAVPKDVLTMAGTLDGPNAHHQRLSSTPMAVVPDSGGGGLMTHRKGFVEMEEHGLLSYGVTGFKRQSSVQGCGG